MKSGDGRPSALVSVARKAKHDAEAAACRRAFDCTIALSVDSGTAGMVSMSGVIGAMMILLLLLLTTAVEDGGRR